MEVRIGKDGNKLRSSASERATLRTALEILKELCDYEPAGDDPLVPTPQALAEESLEKVVARLEADAPKPKVKTTA